MNYKLTDNFYPLPIPYSPLPPGYLGYLLEENSYPLPIPYSPLPAFFDN